MEDHGALTQLALVLAIAFAGGALLQKLHQPVLVGYILAGFSLGPSVLGLVHDHEQIALLAELGILLLLFVIGLELDLKKFAPVYKIALVTVLCQISVGLLAVAGLGILFDWPLARILLLGFAVSLSSTAVAIKLLQDMGEIHTNAGRTAIGVLIAQDIAVIPMLLIIGAMNGHGIHPLEIIKILLALAGMGTLIWTLAKKPEFFVRLIALIPDGQTVIVGLSICFAAAAISGAIGLSAAYGAFLAGLVIGNTAQRHTYEDTIRPVFDVLMMVFFLSVGLMLDLDFLAEKFLRILLLLAVLLALKTWLNIFVLRRLGLARRSAWVMGAALGQIGEFSFVLAALGLSTGAIHSDAYKYVISVIALSLVITPFWLYAVRRTRLLKRNLARRRKRIRQA